MADSNQANNQSEEILQRFPLAVGIETRDGVFTKDAAIFNGYVVDLGGERLQVSERPGRTLFHELGFSNSPLSGIYFHPMRWTTANVGLLAVAYGSVLTINPGGTTPNQQRTFSGVFPGGTRISAGNENVDRVFFEGLPLPDLVRKTGFLEGLTTAVPPLEGFFMNSTLDAYFYNTRVHSLTKINSINYPFTTVGGAAWLNGRFYVMTEEGRIYGSGINDPYAWNAIDFINAVMAPDRGVGVFRQETNLVAMGRNSIEWFYDSGAAIGNPLRRIESQALDLGCKHAASIVHIGASTFFCGSNDKTQEVGIYMLEGPTPQKISTVFIDRILSLGNLDLMWAYPLFHKGVRFYIVTAANLTGSLAYCLDTQTWSIWTTNLVA